MPARMPQITKRFSATPSSPIPVYDDHSADADDTNWEDLSGSGSIINDTAGDDFDPYRQRTQKPNRGYAQVSQEDADIAGPGNRAFLEANGGNPSQPLRMHPPTPDPDAANLPAGAN